MNLKKKSWFILLTMVVIVFSILMSACSTNDDSDSVGKIMSRALSVEIVPDYQLQDYKTNVWDDGTIERYICAYLPESERDVFMRRVQYIWRSAPVISTYMNFTDYISILPYSKMSDVRSTLTKLNNSGSEVIYCFYDKTSDFARKYEQQIIRDRKSGNLTEEGEFYMFKETDPRTPDFAAGFSCGFYDCKNGMLYVYEYEPAYSRKLLSYVG